MRRIRIVVMLVALSGPLLASAVAPPAGADTQVTATTALNVRSAPSTAADVVGGLYRGETVTAVRSRGEWTTVRYAGETAYVASQYLSAGIDLPARASVGTGIVRVATTNLNLRQGPGRSYPIITVIDQGTSLTLTGKSARGYTEVFAGGRQGRAGNQQGWVSTQYLANVSGLPAIVGVRVTTRKLRIRSTSGQDYRTLDKVPKGTLLSITGATQNRRAQIIYRNAVAWVNARYLGNPTVNQPAVPTAARIVATRYATVDLLIRSSSGDTYTVITEVPRGTALSITGVVQNGRAQVVWLGAVRWVNARYLATTPPAAGGTTYAIERGLNPNAIALHRATRARFPQIRTYYGRRPGTGSDHNVGNALDIMIPNYKSAAGRQLGFAVANWARVNQPGLKITYIIWDQRIWNVSRAGEGWRYMASRGSDSSNHKDHVHVSLRPS